MSKIQKINGLVEKIKISCTPPQKVILYQCLKVTIQSIHVLMPIHETD